jgi:hypothetical protein
VTRSRTLDYPTNLGPRIYAVARELFERVDPGPLRLLGVALSGLDDVRDPIQGRLFEEPDVSAGASAPPSEARAARRQEALDDLRKRFGRGTVVPATLLGRRPLHGADGTEGALGRELEEADLEDEGGGAG